jgi:hypothetical protein
MAVWLRASVLGMLRLFSTRTFLLQVVLQTNYILKILKKRLQRASSF